MNRTELRDELAARAGIDKAAAKRVLRALFDPGYGVGIIPDQLDRGDKVVIVGFGTFAVRSRAARRLIDPRTKLLRPVPAARIPAFRPGTPLRQRLQ